MNWILQTELCVRGFTGLQNIHFEQCYARGDIVRQMMKPDHCIMREWMGML